MANSRWEASGFMLASHRTQRPPTRPGRGDGPHTAPQRDTTTKASRHRRPLPERKLYGCTGYSPARLRRAALEFGRCK